MKSILKISIIILCVIAIKIKAQTANFVWGNSMQSTATSHAKSVKVDANGNVFTGGYFYGTVDFDASSAVYNLTSVGSCDIFVCKVDAAGNFLWAKQMGGTSSDFGLAIELDANGNVYTTGSFSVTSDFDPSSSNFNLTSFGGKDIFISKLDALGNFIFAKQMGGTNDDVGNAIDISANGNVYTTGSFDVSGDFDPGLGSYILTGNTSDIFISNIDNAGNFLWAKQMGGTGVDIGFAIHVDANGNLYTTGQFQDVVDFNTGAGTFTLNSGTSKSTYVSKFDASANFLYALKFNTADGGNNYGYSINTDASGNIFVTGLYSGMTDFNSSSSLNTNSIYVYATYIVKINSSGYTSWVNGMGVYSSTSGYISTNECFSSFVDASGNIYTVGDFTNNVFCGPYPSVLLQSSYSNSNEIFITKLTSAGNLVWAVQLPGSASSHSYGYSIDGDNANNIYVSGKSNGTVDFDPGVGTYTVTNNGAFVLKLSSDITNSIAEKGNKNIQTIVVTPNPANNYLQIENINFNSEPYTIEIVNNMGQVVFKKHETQSNTNLDINHFQSGLYFVLIKGNNQIQTIKLIKQ